jgi:hypothetical protein
MMVSNCCGHPTDDNLICYWCGEHCDEEDDQEYE